MLDLICLYNKLFSVSYPFHRHTVVYLKYRYTQHTKWLRKYIVHTYNGLLTAANMWLSGERQQWKKFSKSSSCWLGGAQWKARSGRGHWYIDCRKPGASSFCCYVSLVPRDYFTRLTTVLKSQIIYINIISSPLLPTCFTRKQIILHFVNITVKLPMVKWYLPYSQWLVHSVFIKRFINLSL